VTKLFKKVDTSDGREILSAYYKVASINEANDKAQAVIRIVSERDLAEDQISISLYSQGLQIILHGHSKNPISQDDWAIAEEIEATLR